MPPAAPLRAARRPERIPWGWLEIVIVSQFLFPALLYVPALVPLRTLLRVGAFGVSLMAFAAMFLSGRPAPGRRFPAWGWMAFCAAWLVLMLGHPTTDSLKAGAAAIALNLAIFAPVFWAPRQGTSTARIKRLLAILLICNAASTFVGILQYYRPGRFEPPGLSKAEREKMSDLVVDGQKILRPCGLTDAPGGAAFGGVYTSIIALSWALLPIPWWKRLGYVGLALAGLVVIYFSNVRMALVLVLASQLIAAGMLFMRRDFARLSQLAVIVGLVFAGSLAWVIRSGGATMLHRFAKLLDGSAGEVYQSNRGKFLEDTFGRLIWEYPLGAGLGRWGMTSAYFGAHPEDALWVEIQPTGWIFDGGIPLLIAYSMGILAALYATARIAVKDRDPDLWSAALVFGSIGATLAVNCLSYAPFISTHGVLFWATLGAFYGASQRSEVVRKRAARPAATPLGGTPRVPSAPSIPHRG